MPKGRRTYNRFCPLSLALEDVGERWTLHVVYALLAGPKRYAELKLFLDGAGSNVLGDRLRRLADAHVVGRRTGDRPGSETTYYLTERGRALAPVIKALVDWGLPSLTLSRAPRQGAPDQQAFDQTWAIAERCDVPDETYQWTVDGVDTELVVSGRALTRRLGRAGHPVVTMVTSSEVLSALAAGDMTASQAFASGRLSLTGPDDAVRRMLMVTAMPGVRDDTKP
jgi:DNA-binding HxlR family transcriptional regulator